MSISELRKTSKNGIFSTECLFRCQHPLFFGVKIRIFLDKYAACSVGFPNSIALNPGINNAQQKKMQEASDEGGQSYKIHH